MQPNKPDAEQAWRRGSPKNTRQDSFTHTPTGHWAMAGPIGTADADVEWFLDYLNSTHQALTGTVAALTTAIEALKQAEPLVAEAELSENNQIAEESRKWQRKWAAYRSPTGWSDQDELPEPFVPQAEAALARAKEVLG